MGDEKKYRVKKLEYNVTHHCNLKCDFCDHLSPWFTLAGKDAEFNQKISLDAFRKNLDVLSRYVQSEEFLILGGEPLLNKNVLEFIRAAKESGISQKIVLTTNGFLLGNQKDELFDLLDKISITIYPSAPLKQEIIEKTEAKCAEHSVELEINSKPKFIMSVLGSRTNDSELVNGIFNTCSVAWKNRCYAVHDGYVYRCSRAPFIGYKLQKAGVVAEDFSKQDGLKIEDSDDFGARVKAYFTGEVPLESCAYCLGSVGKEVKHRQATATETQNESWTHYGIDESIDRSKLNRKLAMLRIFHHR